MALDRRSLRRLKKRLPHEYIKAAQTLLIEAGRDLSPSYISQNLGGHRHDEQVILVLIKVADEYQASLKTLAAAARGELNTAGN